MSFPLPFTALSLLHSNLTRLVSTNDDKYDFVDSNVSRSYKNIVSFKMDNKIQKNQLLLDFSNTLFFTKKKNKLEIIKQDQIKKKFVKTKINDSIAFFENIY